MRAGRRAEDLDFHAAVADQVALLQRGDPLGAFDRYFDDEGEMFDNDQLFGSGKTECRAKQAPFITRARSIDGNIPRCTVDAEHETCAFQNQSTFVDASGNPMQIDGVHWQRWSSGKIVEERYYRGELMAQKIADGIFERGEELCGRPVAPD
jgi:hypothetical protein